MKARSSRFARMSSRILRPRFFRVPGLEPLGADEDRLRGLLREGRAALHAAAEHVGVDAPRGACRSRRRRRARRSRWSSEATNACTSRFGMRVVGDDLAPLREELAGDLAVGADHLGDDRRPVALEARELGQPAREVEVPRHRRRRPRRSRRRWRGTAPSAGAAGRAGAGAGDRRGRRAEGRPSCRSGSVVGSRSSLIGCANLCAGSR